MIPPALSTAYWVRIWDARHLLMCLVRLDLRNRYRRSVLGLGWSLLNPIFMTIILCTVFYQMFNQDLANYAPFVVTGLAIWNFLSQTILEGGHSLYHGEKYIRSHPMPMAIYPLRSAMVIGFHFLIMLGLAVVVTFYFKGYPNPLALPALVPSIILCFLFAWSMGVLFGFANVYFPDTQQIVTVGLQMMYFLTPVFYPVDLIKQPLVKELLRLNPLTAFVSIIREPLVESRLPSPLMFGYASLVTLASVSLAIWTLHKKERTLIFHM